jgi:hypothetical protein
MSCTLMTKSWSQKQDFSLQLLCILCQGRITKERSPAILNVLKTNYVAILQCHNDSNCSPTKFQITLDQRSPKAASIFVVSMGMIPPHGRSIFEPNSSLETQVERKAKPTQSVTIWQPRPFSTNGRPRSYMHICNCSLLSPSFLTNSNPNTCR